MRAPLCSDATDLCPEEQGLIGSDSETNCEIQAIEKLEKSRYSKTAVFGIRLDYLMGTSPRVAPQIPFILSRLCHYIEEHGLCHKHLFLEGDENNIVESLKIKFIESGDAPLETTCSVASVAKLLILFFEDLPEPLIPIAAQQDFIEAMENLSLNSMDCIPCLKQNVGRLPSSAYNVLKYLSRFLLRVAAHEEYNGMNCDSLACIFGPVIFRLSPDNPSKLLSVKNVMSYFVQDYQGIFEDSDKSKRMPLDKKLRRQHPCPSSVMPVVSFKPLSVVIPSVDSNQNENNQGNIPVLLIEGKTDPLIETDDKLFSPQLVSKDNIGTLVTRKRKERRFSGEDLQQRSSSEERPSPTIVTLEKIDLMRRCNSHEEMMDGPKANDDADLEVLSKTFMGKFVCQNIDSYLPSFELLVNEKNHSPHPPNAKRRELDSSVHNSNIEFSENAWRNSNNMTICGDAVLPNETEKQDTIKVYQEDSEQNSVAEFNAVNAVEYDASSSLNNGDNNEDGVKHLNNEEFIPTQKSRIPRSASCPVPKTDNEESSTSENLSLSWSMLFEDSEPLRSQHRYSWPLEKDGHEDDALLSPSVQSLRKSNYYEAPLSPSAYRSYLSYRSTHMDASVPPSPPVEQEDFAKSLVESSPVIDSVKQLTKKIHGIKKRIKKFDEKFEAEFGYKPSHTEKANNPDGKKLMNDLYRARKDLKALKEEAHLEHMSSATCWLPLRSSHILGDTTNHILKDSNKEKTKPTVGDSFGLTIKGLCDDRKHANRPESVEAMTTQQIKDEKFAIQKALLQFESMHGKPATKAERNTIRPLYDRYRCVKRLLVRSGSFPGATPKSKDICSELQPILEHEAMDFTSPQHRTDSDSQLSTGDSAEVAQPSVVKDEQKPTSSSQFLAMKYDNSNMHELPLSEMIFQLQQVKSEKRKLRKILREFESEFFKLNGRKVQKEDKAPVETLYGEYKHVKARLKLLDALISKHDQHQLM